MRTLKKNVALLIALAMLLTAVFPAFATQSAFIAGGRSYDSVADLLEALRSRTITYSQVYEYDSEVGYRNVEELDVAEFEAINVLADEEGKDFNDIIGDIASYTERLQAEISTREAEVQVKTAEELLDELEVIEVSAITDIGVELEFSDEIDPTKALRANFRIIDGVGDTERPASVSVSTDKTEVTLSVGSNHAPLNADDAPYQVRIMEAFGQGVDGDYDVVMPDAYPAIEDWSLTDSQNLVLTFERDVKDTDPDTNDWAVEDLTDEDNTSGNVDVDFTYGNDDEARVTVAESGFFKDGRSYELTIAEVNIEDVFGNKNADEVTYTFSTEAPADKPNAVSVEYVANDDVDKVHAVVTFDQPVLRDGIQLGTDSRIVDLDALISTNLDDVSVYDSTEASLDATLGIEDFELNNDQIVLEHDLGVDFRDDREFQLILEDDVVKQRGVLEPLNNEDTTRVTALGVDVEAAKVTAVELVSEEEVKLTFDKAVTYDSAIKVFVAGFDEGGDYAEADTAAGIEASVEMVEDGTVAVLTPDDDDEMFATGFVNANEGHKAVFVNAYAFVTVVNEKKVADAFADGPSQSINFNNPALTDNAAPAFLKALINNGDIFVHFTEDIEATDAGKDIVVAGDAYEHNAGGNDQWTVENHNQIKVAKDGDFEDGVSVSIDAGTVKDGEENENAAIFEGVADLSGATVEGEAPTNEAGTTFDINVENATNWNGDLLTSGTQGVTATSDFDGSLEVNGNTNEANFSVTAGAATIVVDATQLTTLGVHEITVTIDDVTGEFTVNVEVVN